MNELIQREVDAIAADLVREGVPSYVAFARASRMYRKRIRRQRFQELLPVHPHLSTPEMLTPQDANYDGGRG